MSYTKLINEKEEPEFRTKFQVEIDFNGYQNKMSELIDELMIFKLTLDNKNLAFAWVDDLIKIIKNGKERKE